MQVIDDEVHSKTVHPQEAPLDNPSRTHRPSANMCCGPNSVCSQSVKLDRKCSYIIAIVECVSFTGKWQLCCCIVCYDTYIRVMCVCVSCIGWKCLRKAAQFSVICVEMFVFKGVVAFVKTLWI